MLRRCFKLPLSPLGWATTHEHEAIIRRITESFHINKFHSSPSGEGQ